LEGNTWKLHHGAFYTSSSAPLFASRAELQKEAEEVPCEGVRSFEVECIIYREEAYVKAMSIEM